MAALCAQGNELPSQANGIAATPDVHFKEVYRSERRLKLMDVQRGAHSVCQYLLQPLIGRTGKKVGANQHDQGNQPDDYGPQPKLAQQTVRALRRDGLRPRGPRTGGLWPGRSRSGTLRSGTLRSGTLGARTLGAGAAGSGTVWPSVVCLPVRLRLCSPETSPSRAFELTAVAACGCVSLFACLAEMT